MKLDDLRNASASVRALNAALFKAGGVSQGSKPQQAVRDVPLGSPQGEAYYSGRCLVRVTSYRCGRQCDNDNLAPKFAIDALRYARIIHDDRPEDIDYQIQGRRVATKKEERTEIEVIPLPNIRDQECPATDSAQHDKR